MKRALILLLILLIVTPIAFKIGKRAFTIQGPPLPEMNYEVRDTLADGQGREAAVILLGGQSNASGCSHDEYLKLNTSPEKYAEYDAGYDNVYINYYTTGTNVSNGFVKCAARQGESGVCFGPELGMAERLHEMYPDRTFFIIKCAWGGTNLFSQWRSPSSFGITGPLYKYFTEYVNASLEYLVSKNYDVKIEAMCWMQGESDSLSVRDAVAYRTNVKNFVSDIRAEFSEYSDTDGIGFADAYIAENPVWIYHDYLNTSKRKAAESLPMYCVIDTNSEGLTCKNEPYDDPDVVHYDSMSQIRLGHLFAERVSDFLR